MYKKTWCCKNDSFAIAAIPALLLPLLLQLQQLPP